MPRTTTPAEAAISEARQRDYESRGQGSVSVHLGPATARTLLRARGWTVESYRDNPAALRSRRNHSAHEVDPDAFYAAYSPTGQRYWHLEEALLIALNVEAEWIEELQDDDPDPVEVAVVRDRGRDGAIWPGGDVTRDLLESREQVEAVDRGRS